MMATQTARHQRFREQHACWPRSSRDELFMQVQPTCFPHLVSASVIVAKRIAHLGSSPNFRSLAICHPMYAIAGHLPMSAAASEYSQFVCENFPHDRTWC